MIVGVDVRELETGAFTGIGRFLRNFLLYAAESKREDRFVLYGDDRTEIPGLAPHFSFRRLAVEEPIFEAWALPRQLKRDGVQVFLSPYYKGPLASPCPFVITIHDLIFLKIHDSHPATWMKNRLWTLLARSMAGRAARILTDSEHSRNDLATQFPSASGKLTVVPLSVAPHFMPAPDPSKIEFLHRLDLPRSFLLYVGNFRPHKNVPALLEAFASLSPKLREEYPLVLAGPGEPPSNVPEDVKIMPPISEGDLPALYSCASLCVVPSLYEGFGLPALEAMACGTPVLASNRASLPEVVGEAGMLTEPDAASLRQSLQSLLDDPAQFEPMREAGLRQGGPLLLSRRR